MATQKEVKLVFNRVEIEVLVTETCNDIKIQFFNPGTMDFVEDISEVQKGWTFEDKDLKKEYESLIEMAKLIDENQYKAAQDGGVIEFDFNGKILSENV
jgi:hypothetical protein